MNSEGRSATMLAATLIPALFAALYPVARAIEPLAREVEPGRDMLTLRSAKLLKKMSLGHHALLANLYWTRVVQYYGGKRRDGLETFQLLEPLIDITVTLDPNLLVAYKVGAMFLYEPSPRGAGQPEKAAALLHRAVANNPEEWRLWHELGILYSEILRDPQRAAECYRYGSRVPGAREWMKVMAARLAQEGRTRETSRFLWTELHESSPDPNIRKNAYEHLMGLKAEEDAEQLEKIVAKFVKGGRQPRALSELVEAGFLPGIPVDPAGRPYRMEEGRIRLDPRSPVASPILRERLQAIVR